MAAVELTSFILFVECPLHAYSSFSVCHQSSSKLIGSEWRLKQLPFEMEYECIYGDQTAVVGNGIDDDGSLRSCKVK